MSANDEQSERDADLNSEILRTMAEAEAAVDAVHESDTGSPDPEQASTERLEALRADLEATKDRWLRAVADLENYKKRTRREIDEAVNRGVQDLLADFLPTVDNLERALEAAAATAAGASSQVVRGIQMVRDDFMTALVKHGIQPIASVGHAFDPAVHEALQQVESPDHPPGSIVREFEKGYRRGERLLRPARVVIAGPGSGGSDSTRDEA